MEEAKQYEGFVKKIVPKVAETLGLKPRKLYVRITDMIQVPAMTYGRTIFLKTDWFKNHPEDYGTIIHEIAHAIMNIQVAIEEETWLIEGLADYVRDLLGYASIGGDLPSFPHYEVHRIFDGYQATAHFLLWVAKKYGDIEIKNLARIISQGKKLDLDKLELWLQQYKTAYS